MTPRSLAEGRFERQTDVGGRLTSVTPTVALDSIGDDWAAMVQIPLVAARLNALLASSLLNLSDMGTASGITRPEPGLGVSANTPITAKGW